MKVVYAFACKSKIANRQDWYILWLLLTLSFQSFRAAYIRHVKTQVHAVTCRVVTTTIVTVYLDGDQWTVPSIRMTVPHLIHVDIPECVWMD